MYDYKTDKIKDECGVFGIYGHERAAGLTYLGLFSLQHRGEESAGIVTSDGEKLNLHKAMGLVGDVFSGGQLKNLHGNLAIGHVRYSTSGSSTLTNAQPYVVDYSRGRIAVAHNGNLVNAKMLRDELEAYGSIFGSTMDSEIIIHLMAKPTYRNREEGLTGAVRRIRGAYSLTILTEDELIGVRDPQGFRPLCLGVIGEKTHVLASETCAFDLIGARYIRDIDPGEIVIINKKGVKSLYPFKQKELFPGESFENAFCIFEHVYFARPDSLVFGENVAVCREKLGRNLAKEQPAEADIVIPVPDSGNFAALGYAHESGIPFEFGFTRNHYIGRTFIQPAEHQREFKVKVKLNPIRETIEGKRVVVVDDSIVRGNTSKNRVKTLRDAGAKEVHLRISCPPHKFPCYYGIDFPSREELIASKHSVEKIRKFVDADSLGYLSEEGLLNSVSGDKNNYCTACFSGKTKCPVLNGFSKYSMEKGR